ncbi:D-erythronate dehydrogenase [Arthrobacter sp. LAPM80]|uniref:D-erythronate dehydrogenase n=1 Tax=Arthrobacter sp. LAPM80 TaxID=3141788 RepID=UPI00398B104E
MKIIVTGGGGFLGSRVIELLLERKDAGIGAVEFDEIVSLDLAECPVDDSRVTSIKGSIGDIELLHQLVTQDTVGIFHLAAVLSGGSEDDFDLAMNVNVDGTRALLQAARNIQATPRFVFTSSLAVFGGAMPEIVPENMATQPESTYGMVKSIGELLVNEYTRKGYIDGRICRLPTISVRPGQPNSAASSFASSIIREPLNGSESVCPVPVETKMWLSSPNAAVTNLVHAFELGGDLLGGWRVLNVPGLSVTAGEMLESLERVGGQAARDLVSINYDARIDAIVGSWPGAFDVTRTRELGFVSDSGFDQVVQQYHDDFIAN